MDCHHWTLPINGSIMVYHGLSSLDSPYQWVHHGLSWTVITGLSLSMGPSWSIMDCHHWTLPINGSIKLYHGLSSMDSPYQWVHHGLPWTVITGLSLSMGPSWSIMDCHHWTLPINGSIKLYHGLSSMDSPYQWVHHGLPWTVITGLSLSMGPSWSIMDCHHWTLPIMGPSSSTMDCHQWTLPINGSIMVYHGLSSLGSPYQWVHHGLPWTVITGLSLSMGPSWSTMDCHHWTLPINGSIMVYHGLSSLGSPYQWVHHGLSWTVITGLSLSMGPSSSTMDCHQWTLPINGSIMVYHGLSSLGSPYQWVHHGLSWTVITGLSLSMGPSSSTMDCHQWTLPINGSIMVYHGLSSLNSPYQWVHHGLPWTVITELSLSMGPSWSTMDCHHWTLPINGSIMVYHGLSSLDSPYQWVHHGLPWTVITGLSLSMGPSWSTMVHHRWNAPFL